jgi:electron transfer flavoprotein beta subunit
MKIAVLLKQTFDTEAKITIDASGQISRQGVSLIINPYDEYAVEEALRLKEKNGGEVTVISAGRPEGQDALRQALAMGADKAVLVTDEALFDADEYTAAVVLAKAVAATECDLILGGWRAIDDGSAQVAVRVADLLGLPQVNVVTKLEIADGKALATREIEGGSEIIEVPLPAVITAQKGLNEPRYPSMKGIMQAKKKPMQKLSLSDLGLDAGQVAAKVKVVEYFLPSARAAGKIVPGEAAEAACELVKLLREEAKII